MTPLAAREANVPFMAIIAPGEHGYRQRARRFRELGALALLPASEGFVSDFEVRAVMAEWSSS